MPDVLYIHLYIEDVHIFGINMPRHIDDGVVLCAMSAKTETTGAGEKKVKVSANSNNCITKFSLRSY